MLTNNCGSPHELAELKESVIDYVKVDRDQFKKQKVATANSHQIQLTTTAQVISNSARIQSITLGSQAKLQAAMDMYSIFQTEEYKIAVIEAKALFDKSMLEVDNLNATNNAVDASKKLNDTHESNEAAIDDPKPINIVSSKPLIGSTKNTMALTITPLPSPQSSSSSKPSSSSSSSLSSSTSSSSASNVNMKPNWQKNLMEVHCTFGHMFVLCYHYFLHVL